MTIDRRDFMIGAGLAGAAVMAPAIGRVSPAQAAPKKSEPAGNPGYYRTRVGAVTVTTILDGGMQMPNELFTGAKRETLAQAKEEYFLEPDAPFPAYINSFLVETRSRKILIDTGAQGMGPTMGRTKDMLGRLGLKAGDIDEIILTHAHPDHAGGLLGEDGTIAFGKATLRICEDDLNFWYDDAAMAKFEAKKMMFESARQNLSPYNASGQIETYKFDSDLGGPLSSVALPGHTPGHCGVMVSDGGEQLLIWGDIVHNAFLQFDHPEQSLSFDIDEDAARATRQKIFDRAAADRLRIAGMHLPFNAIGHLSRRGKGYAFIPQHWEADI